MYKTMKLSSSTVYLTMKESLKPTQRAQKQTFRWMLKTTIYNCSQKLRLQEKVSEPGTVDANVTLFHGISGAFGSNAIGDRFFLLVVEQLFRLRLLIRVSHTAATPYCVSEPEKRPSRVSLQASPVPEKT
jgi:hypothetical protein